MSTSEDSTVGSGANSAPSGNGSLLSLHKISKTFGPVRALTDVDLDIPAGKVTALIGDNGAGKSSLIKTISGLWSPDGGQIIWEGHEARLHSPRDAEALGITTIYQDLALCENLDIVQNMFLGHELMTGIAMDEASMEIKARETLRELNVVTVRSIRQLVASLSGGQRQSVAVAKAVMSNAKLVIMDEPTAALGVAQTTMVLDLIKRLASRGVSVLLISHNLIDVFEVADRIAVLYLGQLVIEGPVADFDRQSAVEYMTTGTVAHAA
jgi:ABC-type sugar transport system ATPase subunit